MTDRKDPFDIIWKEMESMRNDMGDVINTIHTGRFLPPTIRHGMLPALRGEFKVDVCNQETEVIVVADVPGYDKDAMYIELLNPRTVSIKCEQKDVSESNDDMYFIHERNYGITQRIVQLPCDVTEEGAVATVKNGVLEVIFKKLITTPIPRIEIT